jgi:hypothetical protein
MRRRSALVFSSPIGKRLSNLASALSIAAVSLSPISVCTTASSVQIPRQAAAPIAVRLPNKYCMTHTSGALAHKLMLDADRWSMLWRSKPSEKSFMRHDLPCQVAKVLEC